MKIILPAQTVDIDTPSGGVDPIWYEKLQAIAQTINNGTIGQGLIPAAATTGFGYMPTLAAAAGVPVARPGYAPFVFEPASNRLWIYGGTPVQWRSVALA